MVRPRKIMNRALIPVLDVKDNSFHEQDTIDFLVVCPFCMARQLQLTEYTNIESYAMETLINRIHVRY